MAEFKTPTAKRVGKAEGSNGTPKIVIPPSPLMKQLGYGTGVNVYLMERFSPMHGSYKSPWAVKKRNRMINDEDGEYSKRLNAEANLLKTMSHPNIIGFRSYTVQIDGAPCLAMESGDQSLENLIEKREEADLGPFLSTQILKVARDIACGLQYLHEEKKLLHGDLKSGNILIQGNFKAAKLCDFGVSLKLNEKGVLCDPAQCYVGTECWSAPEVFEDDVITQKTDMFSFGLVLWEMLTLHAPHVDKLNPDSSFTELSESVLSDSLQEEEYLKALGTRPSLPDTPLTEDYLPVLEIFYACTEADPAKRPTAAKILQVLDSILEEKENTKSVGGDRKFLEMLHEDL
ncbi:lymphokine-activated killer T-cell-originated protein kinase-like [Scylla paramamosain]|uniref:lymphokine-activated killer T-cell-originated protein kinase-like n=1 Tax=Scylla paramamosain TaxID=85552 RepID=UPI0030830933